MKNIDLTLMTFDKSFVVIVIIINMALLVMITGSLQVLAFRSPIPQLQPPLLSSSFLSLPLQLVQQQEIPGVIMPGQSQLQQQPISPSTPQQGPIIEGVTTNGTINSVIRTPTTNWIATGQWNLGVNNGTLALFTTNMTWYNSNGAAVHTHEFRNFRSTEVGQPITILPDRSLFLRGVTDVGTNNRIVWKNVQSTISIKGGKTILITVNDAQTNHHFAGQPVFGVVSSFTPCSDVPLPNMEILPPCMSITTAAASSSPSLPPTQSLLASPPTAFAPSNATTTTTTNSGGGQQLQSPTFTANPSNATGNTTTTTTTNASTSNTNNTAPGKSPFDILGGG